MNADPQALFSAFLVVATMLLVGFPVHEALHAWTASRLGDNTARFQGRVSLNPWIHFDPLGGGILILTAFLGAFGGGSFLFGWAKPTPVNPWNMRYGRRGHALVAFAGPASNLVVAIVVGIVFRLLRLDPGFWNSLVDDPLTRMLLSAGILLLNLNILLFIFNMLPIPPLDGWSVLKGIVPRAWASRMDELTAQYANLLPLVFMGFFLILILSGGAILGPVISGISGFLKGF